MNNNVLKIGFTTAIILVCCFFSGNYACADNNEKNKKLKVAVLYNNTPTGKAYLSGIQDANNFYGFGDKINLILKPYSKQDEGEDILKNLIYSDSVHVILGPTESEVFVRVEKLDDLQEHNIPVISGLVTAEEGNKENGCFFRINLDVSDRVNTIWNFIDKYWISSLAIIYQNSEFGIRAETALKKRLDEKKRSINYISYRLEPKNNLSEVMERVVSKQRPEVIALFCEREYITTIYNDIIAHNRSGVKYSPIFFTIIDISKISKGLNDFYFISLIEFSNSTNVDSVKTDEVYAFGFDTWLLLKEALFGSGEESNGNIPYKGDILIGNILNLLNSAGKINGSKTSMNLINLKNYARPHIYEIKDHHIYSVSRTDNINWFKQLWLKCILVSSVYGNWIILNIILITIITFFICRMDMHRSFPRKHIKIFKTLAFYYYFLTNLLIVFFLYFFLSETGRIHYSDTLMAIIISVTPSAFMKTTFFETRQGKSIGLEGIYKWIMARIDRLVMKSRYENLESLTNIIAYYNSEDSMRRGLLRMYKNNPSTSHAAKLIQQMEEEMNNEKDYLNRRRVGARLLMKQFDLEQLRAEGFIPQNWDAQNQFNPLTKLREAARYCSKSENKIKDIDNILNDKLSKLEEINPERHKEILEFYKKELSITMTIEGGLIVKLRTIMVISGFDLDWFYKKKLLPKNNNTNTTNEENIEV